MKKEFKLDEKRFPKRPYAVRYSYPEENVKESIKLINNDLFDLEEKTAKKTGLNTYDVLINGDEVREIINKRMGKKLSQSDIKEEGQ